MTAEEREIKVQGVFSCGVVAALVGSCLSADTSLPFILFLFGATYGGLWIVHD